VYCDQVLGKPSDIAEAGLMLRQLQGNAHWVFTGVALVEPSTGRVITGYERTEVFFRPLSEGEIARYVATGEPLDKAGSYGAQGLGAVFIERINGSYDNVVGLPLSMLTLMLKEFGYNVL
jgi:septum formation protein